MNATTDSVYSQWEEAIIEEAADYRAYNSVDLAAFVFILFEYLITFDNEVECVWRRKLTWARLILLLNRYIALVLYLLSITPLIPAENLLAPLVRRLIRGYFTVSILTRVCSVAYEAIIVAVTWMKTWTYVRANALPGIPKSVMTFVLHEGILYFTVIMVLNAIQLVFIWVEADTLSLALAFLNPLTSILISRFYFGLDELRREEEASALPSQSSGPATTIRFGRESDMLPVASCHQLLTSAFLRVRTPLFGQYETDSEISFGDVVFAKVVSTSEPYGRGEY
ncbi:hypothetical protein C8Q73DRAFT_786418 [Cubamyces lactineus]|nr:hypothetical protein C8Q73DRAFT_786418 [Cubamyces lactineus]